MAWLKDLRLKHLGQRIEERLRGLDPKDVTALAACGAEIRSWIAQAPFPTPFEQEIRAYFQWLENETSGKASFAGQQETFLNISDQGFAHGAARSTPVPEEDRHRFSLTDAEVLELSRYALASGRAIGHKIGSGTVRVVPDASHMAKIKAGDILVTLMDQGIESLSLNPDTVVSTWLSLAESPPPEKKSAVA